MFQLTETELQNAFEAISHHGNSAMLPPPYEWRFAVDKWPDVKAYLAQQDLDIYEAYKPLRVFAPKSRATIRVLHLLHPEDLLIYTALVLIVKNDIENARISKKARRVYSYRVDVSALFELAEWLFVNHGLTLQAAKTKLLPVSRYTSTILSKPEEHLTDRDHVISLLKETGGMEGYDDEIADEELDDEEIETTLQQLHGYDLHGMLTRSVSDQALVDYEVVKYVLTRLPRIPNVDEELKQDVLHLVIENAELLYPAAEYIATYILSFELSRPEKRKIAKKLLKPLKSKRSRPPDYYIMWVLYIFSSSEEWNQMADIVDIYRSTTSEVVKRYAALALAVGGTRSEALIVKDDLPSAPDMLRLAILSASNKLGKDERRHWKLAHQIRGIVEKVL